jgi:AAA15 family ATPase/GTPase
MYKTFRVKNFRCFKDLQINDLGRVNLIAGKNNTGKTALMEAMYAFTKPLTPLVLFQLQQSRGLDLPESEFSIYWKQFFYNMDAANTIQIEASNPQIADGATLTIQELDDNGKNDNDFYVYRMRRTPAIRLDERVKSLEKRETILKCMLTWDEEKLPVYVYFAPDLLEDSVKDSEDESQFIPTQYRISNEETVHKYSQLVVDDVDKQFERLLHTIEPRLTKLLILSPWGQHLVWAELDGVRIPLRLLGEGFNRFGHFLMSMMADKPDYLFIDEIENGIHHSVQKKVWKAIGQAARDLDIQVFATTHSLEMIRAAYEAFADTGHLDEFRYHRLDRDDETGDIEAVTYNEPALDAVASFDFDFEVRG